jgi:hypothetical protein
MLDLAQDRLDIFGYRAFAQAGIGNRDHRRRDIVGKISPSSDRFLEVGIERDFVAAHCAAKKPSGSISLWPVFIATVGHVQRPRAAEASPECPTHSSFRRSCRPQTGESKFR